MIEIPTHHKNITEPQSDTFLENELFFALIIVVLLGYCLIISIVIAIKRYRARLLLEQRGDTNDAQVILRPVDNEDAIGYN